MNKRIIPSFFLYTATAVLVLGWWYAAFMHFNHPSLPKLSAVTHRSSPKMAAPKYLSYLSPMDRHDIQKALSGDAALMTKLITEWDVDAGILENHGLIGVHRLPRQTFIKAQIIGRQLERPTDTELQILRQRYCQNEVIDDAGQVFNTDAPFHRYLPQTYISASFLLALTEPDNIVAIPWGFRDQTQLYPNSVTSKIPLDFDRYKTEEIYLAQPEVAFVAHYSLPSTLQALRAQQIPLFTLKSVNTFPEIQNAITRIGHVIDRPLEAELLTLFMESALLAIDNHILAMGQALLEEHGTPQIMFLNYHAQYSVPTAKTLAGQLLERLHKQHNFTFLTPPDASEDDWMTPIDHEQIVRLNPECLIISSTHAEALEQKIKETSALAELEANRDDKVYFVDGAVFDSPTQYIVLAYYDLAQVLVEATSPYAR